MPTIIISRNATGAYTGNFSGVIDSQIKSPSNDTTNYGSGLEMEITKYATGNHTHSLLAFTGLSNIPAGSIITAATLGIHFNNANLDTISLKRLLRNWVEAQVTWNIYSTGNSWTTVGALSDGNDRSATLTASSVIVAPVGWTTWADAQLITDIQAIVDGTANYGWHFERTDAADDGHFIIADSSEATDGIRPYLSVTYTAGGLSIPVAMHHYAQMRGL